MPQKKNSKKDLEKRVGKLKKKVATLTKGLNKKQSELSRALSSVQKKLDGLRKQKAPGKRLLKTAEDLASRLQGLEEKVAVVGRTGVELAVRTHALETRAAETDSGTGALLRSGGESDASPLHGIELLRDRIRATEDDLGRLSAAQEGLELQIALLSREAEGEGEPAARAGQGAWAKRAAELATQLKDVQSRVVREKRDTADLAERSNELETSASELLQAEQALETRVSQLEQLSSELQLRARSDDAPEAGYQVPELQRQITRAEEAADSLSRRTTVLEAGHEALAKDDARLASQLQAVEMRLSELAHGAGEVAAEPPETLQNLEQQVALLSADRSLHHTRIEEILRRAEALEKTGFNYTRHTDALSDRITLLNEGLEGLMALDAERRLADLEGRGEALEQSLQAETAGLGELRQTEDTLEQRLNMAIADAEALESRIDKLNQGSEQLNDELARLDSAFERAAKEAQQQHDRMQAHDTLLGQQKQQLEALVEAQDKADAGLGARFATLDESRQALQEASDGLRVQLVRQEHDTQSLQRKLQRRTGLGLLMLLLTAGALVFLLLRGPVVPEALQSAMQAGSAADERAAAAIADIEKDVATMRRELTVLNDSLAQLAGSVNEVEAQSAPELPAQVTRLSSTVETLERQGMQQQQETAELRTGLTQQKQDGAELRAGQEQLQTALERIADEVKSLGEKTDAAPVMGPASRAVEAGPAEMSAWVQARESGRYTLQLAGFYHPESLVRFKKMHALGADSAVYQTEFQGRAWHVVFHGIYETVDQALAAAKQLSPGLASHKPWVRRIPSTGKILPL
jgi:septal ring-binding cell division protein DamX